MEPHLITKNLDLAAIEKTLENDKWRCMMSQWQEKMKYFEIEQEEFEWEWKYLLEKSLKNKVVTSNWENL